MTALPECVVHRLMMCALCMSPVASAPVLPTRSTGARHDAMMASLTTPQTTATIVPVPSTATVAVNERWHDRLPLPRSPYERHTVLAGLDGRPALTGPEPTTTETTVEVVEAEPTTEPTPPTRPMQRSFRTGLLVPLY